MPVEDRAAACRKRCLPQCPASPAVTGDTDGRVSLHDLPRWIKYIDWGFTTESTEAHGGFLFFITFVCHALPCRICNPFFSRDVTLWRLRTHRHIYIHIQKHENSLRIGRRHGVTSLLPAPLPVLLLNFSGCKITTFHKNSQCLFLLFLFHSLRFFKNPA